MRKKTDVRRDAILAAAAQEFGLRGYDGASMAAIVARTGGSKQTLYAYFPSKEALFVEVMARTICDHVDTAYAELDDEEPLAASLTRYGERYLNRRQLPEMVALVRLAFGEAGRSDIGRQLYSRVRQRGIGNIATVLASAMRAGQLRQSDPEMAAVYFFALLDAELVTPVVLRVREPASATEIIEIVARAVCTFLAAYHYHPSPCSKE